MTKRLFPSPEFPAVPVTGTDLAFPIHRIFCVGRNYAEHAKEMGVEVDREAPFYFLKHPLSYVATGATIPYPPGTENYHYEMELVIAIGAPLFKGSVEAATAAIYGYAAGLDMTRRDLQLKARASGRPWDFGKDFEQSAVVGPITPAADWVPVDRLVEKRMWLKVDGQFRQDVLLKDLIWSVPEIVSHLSRYYHLQPGDLIYTGTPAGVGPVTPGNVLEGEVEGLAPIRLTIAEPE